MCGRKFYLERENRRDRERKKWTRDSAEPHDRLFDGKRTGIRT